MSGQRLAALGAALLVGIGCQSREHQNYGANDRVNVRAPGVNVRVGEEGGVNVKAPFTRIETSQYRQQTPKNSTQNNFNPPAWGEGSSRATYWGDDVGGVRKTTFWSPTTGSSTNSDLTPPANRPWSTDPTSTDRPPRIDPSRGSTGEVIRLPAPPQE